MSRSGALEYGRPGSWYAPRSQLRRTRTASPHLGLCALPRIGLDSSLDRHHLNIAYALNSALEHAARDRAHDAREVDLNPHHGVGLLIVHRLEFHSPARRGSTHWPGERHGAGRLDNGHFLAPAATQPEHQLPPLLHPRAGLKRSSSADPAFENRRRPLRPTSDVTDIRPHLRDAAGDCYAALGSECHRAALPGWLCTPGGTGLLRRQAVSAFAISCVVCSQPCRVDRRCRAAARSRCRWRSSPSQSPSAAARAAGSPGKTNWPGRGPSAGERIASGSPPRGAAMTGRPWASASVTAMP